MNLDELTGHLLNVKKKLTQKLARGLLMVVQLSLNPGQEKASYQTAEFAQAFFSEENLREAKSFDQKENAKRFRI